MSLITKDEAKTFLGIEATDTDSDAEITQLIPKAEALFYSMIKVDTLEEDTRDEIAVVYTRGEIWFNNFPITAINTIGGEAYSGVDFDDYIATKNKVKFHCPEWGDKVKSKRIKVNYTFGYAEGEIPQDLQLAILILVSGFYNLKENYGTVSCKIGQESYSFRSISESEDYERIVKAYKKKFNFVI